MKHENKIFEAAVSSVAFTMGVSENDIVKRKKNIAALTARQYIYNLLRTYSNMTLKTIGNLFGKTHSSVMEGINQFNNHSFCDKRYLSDYKKAELLFLQKLSDYDTSQIVGSLKKDDLDTLISRMELATQRLKELKTTYEKENKN
jgi:hypothetical protein